MITYHKALINVKAYLPEDKEIINIIKLCNLRNDNKNWKIWYDDLGNKLVLNKKNIKIKKYNSFIIKDLHHKLHPNIIINNTSLLLINLINDFYYCLLYTNNTIKLSIYKDNNWIENQPPLSAGIENLRLIIKNIDKNIKIIKLVNDEICDKITESLGIKNAS